MVPGVRTAGEDLEVVGAIVGIVAGCVVNGFAGEERGIAEKLDCVRT